MTPLETFTQVLYKGKAGEIIEVQSGYDRSPDGCMYMIELEDNTYPILKRGEFDIINNGDNGPSMFMGMLWEEL